MSLDGGFTVKLSDSRHGDMLMIFTFKLSNARRILLYVMYKMQFPPE